MSTPLEPCRVAPYVNLPSLRGNSVATPSTPQHFSGAVAAAAAFSAFDPALLSAAHQVCHYHSNTPIHMHIVCVSPSFVCANTRAQNCVENACICSLDGGHILCWRKHNFQFRNAISLTFTHIFHCIFFRYTPT